MPLIREMAADCSVTIEFRAAGHQELAIPEVLARWSARPEPIRIELTEPELRRDEIRGRNVPVMIFDPGMVPQTETLDLPPFGRWEEVAVTAMQDDGEAYASGSDSYRDPLSKITERFRGRGVYDVIVRMEAAGVSKVARFQLDNLKADFVRFALQPIP